MGDIATSYISKLRMFLCPDGVVGSSNRWWSGKKDFDFLQIEESSSSQVRFVTPFMSSYTVFLWELPIGGEVL